MLNALSFAVSFFLCFEIAMTECDWTVSFIWLVRRVFFRYFGCSFSFSWMILFCFVFQFSQVAADPRPIWTYTWKHRDIRSLALASAPTPFQWQCLHRYPATRPTQPPSPSCLFNPTTTVISILSVAKSTTNWDYCYFAYSQIFVLFSSGRTHRFRLASRKGSC